MTDTWCDICSAYFDGCIKNEKVLKKGVWTGNYTWQGARKFCPNCGTKTQESQS